MKAVKEALSPTRVKLTVEVPFEELRPSMSTAYKKLGRQVRVQGFRPGKVPPAILDQRVGRGVVLDEALQDALPRFYGEAARDQQVDALGRPEVDVTSFADGAPLVFTAEVDVRPAIELPDYAELPVDVDAVAVEDHDVDEQLELLRDRFAVLEGVERPVESGDYLSLDLAATVDGVAVEGAGATGLSYEAGSANLVVGLDDAVTGASAGDTRTFTTALVGGDFAGQEAEVSVVVRSVKRKVLPALDDDFATTASEFDSLEELRADIRHRLERTKLLEQGVQARDRTLEVLVERTEVPLPASVVQAEIEARMHELRHQLEQAGLELSDYLQAENKSAEEFEAEMLVSAEAGVRGQFILDAIAIKEEITVTQGELADQIVRRAQSAGLQPQDYANQLAQAGQVGALAAQVARGKALALVMQGARVTDSAGTPVDLEALRAQLPESSSTDRQDDDAPEQP
jgi:trigger factor